ncbi:Alpha-1,6-mannosylglycoprotein 6-beta-N-acetylglucosaminyltransferase B [Takifugu flavidus]|uniref:Alpha-1,6-mannosylglycoprotein 6-beta-N-acetylglucosaminyltransferase B n=1 Tax=Takifugu flavidus TaxID=433684 RepID=A0A5C6MZN3_9TELE|nr:Alpha-1,6-mannosylglycoprotein 6-beta-N-acetylglucosaminyltransferase B [Takifugu flavidus]
MSSVDRSRDGQEPQGDPGPRIATATLSLKAKRLQIGKRHMGCVPEQGRPGMIPAATFGPLLSYRSAGVTLSPGPGRAEPSRPADTFAALGAEEALIFVVGIGFFSLCFLMTSLGGQFSAKRLGDSPFTIRTEEFCSVRVQGENSMKMGFDEHMGA